MEEISKELVLVFGAPGMEELKITIAKPGRDITATDIKNAMEDVIATGAFGEKAIVDKIVKAQYVVKQVESVELA